VPRSTAPATAVRQRHSVHQRLLYLWSQRITSSRRSRNALKLGILIFSMSNDSSTFSRRTSGVNSSSSSPCSSFFRLFGERSLPDFSSRASHPRYGPFFHAQINHASDLGLGSIGTPASNPSSRNPSSIDCRFCSHTPRPPDAVPSASRKSTAITSTFSDCDFFYRKSRQCTGVVKEIASFLRTFRKRPTNPSRPPAAEAGGQGGRLPWKCGPVGGEYWGLPVALAVAAAPQRSFAVNR
jgi:hypothetical protein